MDKRFINDLYDIIDKQKQTIAARQDVLHEQIADIVISKQLSPMHRVSEIRRRINDWDKLQEEINYLNDLINYVGVMRNKFNG